MNEERLLTTEELLELFDLPMTASEAYTAFDTALIEAINDLDNGEIERLMKGETVQKADGLVTLGFDPEEGGENEMGVTSMVSHL